jgi:hypothetical protein
VEKYLKAVFGTHLFGIELKNLLVLFPNVGTLAKTFLEMDFAKASSETVQDCPSSEVLFFLLPSTFLESQVYLVCSRCHPT